MISFAIQPFSFIFVIYVVSQGRLLTSALAGAICSFIVGVGLADLPIELAGMRARSKFYDILMSLPGSVAEKILGISIGISIPALPYLTLLSVLLVLKAGLTNIVWLVLSTVILWVSMCSLGIFIGIKCREPLTVMRLANILTMLLTIFPPVYYPIHLVPEWLRMPLFVIPTVSASYLMTYGYSDYGLVAILSLTMWLLISCSCSAQ